MYSRHKNQPLFQKNIAEVGSLTKAAMGDSGEQGTGAPPSTVGGTQPVTGGPQTSGGTPSTTTGVSSSTAAIPSTLVGPPHATIGKTESQGTVTSEVRI